MDVLVDSEGFVEPVSGGIGVAPEPLTNLAAHRLPRDYGGTGRDPVFELETGDLPETLR